MGSGRRCLTQPLKSRGQTLGGMTNQRNSKVASALFRDPQKGSPCSGCRSRTSFQMKFLFRLHLLFPTRAETTKSRAEHVITGPHRWLPVVRWPQKQPSAMDVINRKSLLPQKFKSGPGADKALSAGESMPQQRDRKGTASLPVSPREKQIRAMTSPTQGTTGTPVGLPSPEAAGCQIPIWKPPAMVAISFLEGSANDPKAGLSSPAQQQL